MSLKYKLVACFYIGVKVRVKRLFFFKFVILVFFLVCAVKIATAQSVGFTANYPDEVSLADCKEVFLGFHARSDFEPGDSIRFGSLVLKYVSKKNVEIDQNKKITVMYGMADFDLSGRRYMSDFMTVQVVDLVNRDVNENAMRVYSKYCDFTYYKTFQNN